MNSKYIRFERILILLYLVSLSIPTTYFNVFGIESPFGNLNIIRLSQIAIFLILFYRRRVYKPTEHEAWVIIFVLIFQSVSISKDMVSGAESFASWFSSMFNRIFLHIPAYYIITRYRKEDLFSLFTKCLLSTAILQVFMMLTIESWNTILGLKASISFTYQGISRYSGVFAWGDANSLAGFQVALFAIFYYLALKGRVSHIYALLTFVTSSVTVAYTASRGGFLSLGMVLLLGLYESLRLGKIKVKTIRAILSVITGIVLIISLSPQLFDNVGQRVWGAQTEGDLDLSNEAGRFGRVVVFYQFIMNNPSVLLYGDNSLLWRDWYGRQVVHVAFINAIQIGGLVFGLFFAYIAGRLIKWGWKKRAMYLIAPILVSFLTLPGTVYLIYYPMIIYIAESEEISRHLNNIEARIET